MRTQEEIIEINKKQKEFYNHKKKNLPTRIWSFVREKTLKKIRKDIGVLNQSYDLHKVWFGDVSNKKVLDLGCFAGNYWSLYLAEHSKQYIGLDLSDLAIEKLNKRIEKFPNAKAVAVDFLSDDFAEKDFDIIYAYGVLHHFQNPDVLIAKLNEKLAPNGTIISYDPLETSLPIKFIRVLYRPFQSDKDWEWPFSRKTYYKFHNTFKVIERHGVLGQAKWYFLINLLPISDEKKQAIGKKWHKKDWDLSATSDSHLFKCMQLTMLMQKK
ncbi:class I SAM-dependent methyltransferase [Flavobacterium dankookense]|uniref:Methyltransferase family protein n=1 Tax=Flavobacterium dankookense TaxID=706186 RepID=A0A4R6Q9F8_9FLAO|nr:class I SAM-dependent methyltransferase [Flavobacterium dankookense]TDP59228.1 methyltransferase family protein [Flavobacterium dankookense]